MASEPWKDLGISRALYYKRSLHLEPVESKKVDTKPVVVEIKKPIRDKSLLFGGHRIQKGQVLNPGGRPKMEKNVRALARQYTAISIQTLADIVKDSDSASQSRVAAAQALLDRGWGKPLQQIEAGGPGAFSDMSDEDLIEFTKLNLLRVQQLKETSHVI